MAQAHLGSSTVRLCDQLCLALCKCKVNNKEFLPENCLKDLVKVSSIKAELKVELGWQLYFNPQLAKNVYEKASKVFAILAMISQVGAMKDLYQEGLTDKDLPLRPKNQEFTVLESVPSLGKEFKSFARYYGSARLFDEKQWRVLAPVLDMSSKHVIKDERCALPIVDAMKFTNGGSSSIFKGTIHEAHWEALETRDERDRIVAIKEFQATEEHSERQNFNNEKVNLDEIYNLDPHPHLIRAIATCEFGDTYYTLFPWADGGDLTGYWESQESALGYNTDHLLWSLRQMLGIADAVKTLHGTNYRHGDLKPDNILHFKRGNPFCKGSNDDILVIADFGVSKKHGVATDLRPGGTSTRATTLSYEAPEADGKQTVPRSRRYDMWSMGCILLEFAVWLLYGRDAIKNFRQARIERYPVINQDASFYVQAWEEDRPNFEINPAVVDAMDALENDPRCQGSTAIGDLIARIRKHLLQLKAEKRATAEDWWKELEILVLRAMGDESYLINNVNPSLAIPDVFSPKP